MKKTIQFIAFSIMLLLLLTGCGMNYNVQVYQDGSADVTYVAGYTKDFLKNMGSNMEELSDDDFKEMTQAVSEDGYAVEKYADHDLVGFKATKHLNNVTQEMSLQNAFGEAYIKDSDENRIQIDKNFFITKYSQQANFDFSSLSKENDATKLMDTVKVKYSVTLPTKVKEHNATKVSNDGKTLEWDIIPGQNSEVKFEAQGINQNAIIAGVILVAILIIIIFAIIASRKGKKKVIAKATATVTKTPKPVKQEENKEEEKQDSIQEKPILEEQESKDKEDHSEENKE